ncbi:MAG: hypothetical protein AAGA30_14920, partial [Planctomycetota bacterium]
MSKKIGGVLHTYLKYQPDQFPSPTNPPPDFVSPLMNQMLAYGSLRELTDEELAKAVRLDPSQFQNLGPSLDMIQKILEERKRKILETYETDSARQDAKKEFRKSSENLNIPPDQKQAFKRAVHREQLYELERLWYQQNDDASEFARSLVQAMSKLADKYQVDELAAKYQFIGRSSMTAAKASEIKEELEKIDELLEQLKEARKNAQIALIDMDELGEFIDEYMMQSLEEMQRMIENYVKESAERQGLENSKGKFSLSPQAYRVYQSKLLDRIFSDLETSKSGRH